MTSSAHPCIDGMDHDSLNTLLQTIGAHTKPPPEEHFTDTAHPLFIVHQSDDHPWSPFLIRQSAPDEVSVQCVQCTRREKIHTGSVLAGMRAPRYPKDTAFATHATDDEIVTLLRRAGFDAAVATTEKTRQNEACGFTVKAVCCRNTMRVIHRMDGTREARCPQCPPHLATLQFVARFDVGFRMATGYPLKYIQPRPTEPPEPTQES